MTGRWNLRTGFPALTAQPGLWLTHAFSKGNEQPADLDRAPCKVSHILKNGRDGFTYSGPWPLGSLVREELGEGGDELWREQGHWMIKSSQRRTM